MIPRPPERGTLWAKPQEIPVRPRGSTFDPAQDAERLGRQYTSVLSFTLNTGWHTLAGIASAVHAPEASVSARLRDFRRAGYTVERRRVPDGNGLHEYRVIGGGA